tara:strand:+ start:2596 stop:3465 length:870 start_codon:yes stop_codon:yes gene_type:complete
MFKNTNKKLHNMRTKTFFLLVIFCILLYACKDEEIVNTPNQTSTQASQDHLFAENIFNDINRVVEDGFNDNGLSKSSCANYKSIAADSSDADTLIIDFGEVDCLDEYGKLRRGKIIVIYTAPYQDSLAVITTTFNHYYVNSTNWVQGSRTITNLGRNAEVHMVFDIAVDANITTEIGRIDWLSNRTRIWTEGKNTTQNPFDDVYKVVGTASGNGLNNNDFTVEITDSLEVNLGCLLPTVTYNKRCAIVSGKVKVSPNGYSDRVIDYGIDGCNCDYSVTINEESYLIVVP